MPRFLSRPEWILVLTFAGLVAVGTALLLLPAARAEGKDPVTVVDAAFMSTSAVCVTGLITRDTATDFSLFGQVVILGLIQIGGLGVMTFGALAMQILHARVSFSSQAALHDTFYQLHIGLNVAASLKYIVMLTLAFELVGMLCFRMFIGDADPSATWFDCGFLAVSAFCNAGFSVYSDSVMSVATWPVVTTLMVLIVVGGLGHSVLMEALARLWKRLRGGTPDSVRVSLHTRLVLVVSLLLILGGAAAMGFTGLTPSVAGWADRLKHALFQSVTARTAGFNTVDIGVLPLASLMILIPLMFIGGSPGSAAGGAKTTSTAVWLLSVANRIRGRYEVSILGRRIPEEIVRRAGLVMGLGILWVLGGVFILAVTERRAGFAFEQIIFEQVSAFATVGLTTGITPELSTAGRIWIILSMFVGRLGPLTIGLAVLRAARRTPYLLPREAVMIG